MGGHPGGVWPLFVHPMACVSGVVKVLVADASHMRYHNVLCTRNVTPAPRSPVHLFAAVTMIQPFRHRAVAGRRRVLSGAVRSACV